MNTYPEYRSEMKDPQLISKYILGGSGMLTLESPTGKHHTYFFKKPREINTFPEDTVFVYALHEKTKLFYVGMIERGRFRLTHCSRFLNDTEIVRGARFIEKMSHKKFDTPMKLYHEGMCCRCGRKLTNPDSIKEGIGKRCKHKMETLMSSSPSAI